LDPLVFLLGKIRRDPTLMKNLHALNSENSSLSELSNFESFDELQMRIKNTNSNALSGTLPQSDYSGFESYGHFQSLENTLISNVDHSAVIKTAATKTKDIKAHRRKEYTLFPQWMYSTPFLSADFLPSNCLTAKPPHFVPLDNLPLNVQERLIVQDLLSCLQGCDGVYIKALKLENPHAMRNFAIDEKMRKISYTFFPILVKFCLFSTCFTDPSLMDTVNKVVPLISQYSLIERFVEEKASYGFGRVDQALSEALQEILQENWKLICQLDQEYRSNQLGVSRLLLLLKETGHLFNQLALLIAKINTGDCIGGATLTLLYESLNQVSVIGRVHDCMLYLLRAACQPFFESLSSWVYRGILKPEDEKLGEFFITKVSNKLQSGAVRENDRAMEYINSAFFWDRSYCILSTQLPTFLESHAEKILAAGKYLNVVQQCDSSQQLAEPEPLVFSENEQDFLAPIDRAHAFASRTVLDFILKQKDLKGILKSIKRYFLLDQGDFIVHFMDVAANELRKPISQVSISALNSLLEWVLQTSSAVCDPYKDNLRVASTNCDLITQILTLQVGNNGTCWSCGLLTGVVAVVVYIVTFVHVVHISILFCDTIVDVDPSTLEAFSLDYIVDWPTVLVINRLVLDRYQLLFRHLFYCRHVERHLSSSWAMRKAARRATDVGALAFNTAFILGQRMLTYIQSLQHYMTIEVIEPNWQAFYQFLNKADNLDEVLEAHEKCLEYCMDDCLLTSPDLLALVGKLNAICIQYANCLNHLADASLDDTLESVPMSSAASMHHLSHPRRVGVSASTSLSNLATPLGTLKRRTSVASSDGGSLFRGADNSSNSGSNLDSRRRVAASDLGNVGANEQFAIAVDHFSTKFNDLIVKLLIKIRQSVDRKRVKLHSLASRLVIYCFFFVFFYKNYDGFYTRYSLENANQDGSKFKSLIFGPGGLGGPIRPSLSMSSITTLDSAIVGPPRRLVGERGGVGDEETLSHLRMPIPLVSSGSRQKQLLTPGSMLPPAAPQPQPRERRNSQLLTSNGSVH
uniref:Gamma-tubulin complex component n=1 Tax=Rodentolepis nana TaxID=102285 RepID=A0A158QGF3_RODNA